MMQSGKVQSVWIPLEGSVLVTLENEGLSYDKLH